MQKAVNLNDVAIVSIKGNDYRIHFRYMSKDDAISISNVMLNRAIEYYENNKEVLTEKAKIKCRELSEEKKI